MVKQLLLFPNGVDEVFLSGHVIIENLPQAVALKLKGGSFDVACSLSSRPVFSAPISIINVLGADIASNKLLAFLGSIADEICLVDGGKMRRIQAKATSLQDLELQIFELAYELYGSSFLNKLAAESAPILSERQQRLEILRCLLSHMETRTEANTELVSALWARLESISIPVSKRI